MPKHIESHRNQSPTKQQKTEEHYWDAYQSQHRLAQGRRLSPLKPAGDSQSKDHQARDYQQWAKKRIAAEGDQQSTSRERPRV